MARGGFTTVRDLGGDAASVIAVRDAVAEGRFPGPRIKVSGDPLSIIGGHADSATGLPPELAQAVDAAHLSPAVCTGVEQCQEVVRHLAAKGVDVIKIMDAVQNARLIANAEQYYRIMVTSDGGVSGRTELGQFQAQRLRADLNGRTIVLDGGARLKIVQGAVR